MAVSVQQILDAAHDEWKHWGNSVWDLVRSQRKIGHRDDEEDFARYVITNYCSVGGGNPSVAAIQNDAFAWSAVGMSAIMKTAGYTKHDFPFSIRHSTFIRHFVKARKNGDTSADYWGFQLGEKDAGPDIGDLVAYARGDNMTQAKALALFNSTSSYQSHTDVVVDKRPGEIDVIGFNVMDSVTMKTLKLGVDGHIKDSQHFWFALLKKQ